MGRALLAIDVQNGYFTGALPITHPAGHLDRILGAMDAAAGRIPTVVIRHTFAGPDRPFFRRGTPGWELHPEVAGRPRDAPIDKNLPGSFTGTGLEEWLRERGISTVTIAGYMTHAAYDGKRMYVTDSLPSSLDHSGCFHVRLVHIGPDGMKVDPFFNIDLNKLPTGPAMGHDVLMD